MSKKIDSFMPLWIADYWADTPHLTCEQHGAYLLLLMAYWRNGGPLPNDDRRLAGICKLSLHKWKNISVPIREFFEVSENYWTQDRAERELRNARKIQEDRQKSGALGAAKRWQGYSNPIAEGMASASQNDSTSPSPSQSKKESKKESKSASSEKSDAGPSGPLDVKKLVWQTGVQYLTRNGVSEAQARTVIGKWRRHYRDADILNAMAASDSEVAANPIAFIQKVLNRSETNDRRSEQFKPSDVFRRSYAAADDTD